MNQWPGRRRTAKHLKGQMPMLLGPRVLHYPPCPQPGGVSLFEISDVSHTGSLSTPLSESKGRGPCPRYRTFLITPLSSFRKGVLVRCLDSHEALSSFSSLFFNEVTSAAIVFNEVLSSYGFLPTPLSKSEGRGPCPESDLSLFCGYLLSP
jgi:hypothetical protein